MSRDDKEVYQ